MPPSNWSYRSTDLATCGSKRTADRRTEIGPPKNHSLRRAVARNGKFALNTRAARSAQEADQTGWLKGESGLVTCGPTISRLNLLGSGLGCRYG
jgi:hypothetical protein